MWRVKTISRSRLRSYTITTSRLLLIARLAYQSDSQLARKVIDVQLRTSTFDRFINAGLHDEL